MKPAAKPSHLKPIFWDIDFGKLDVKKYPRYVIERVLEYGDLPQVRWMLKAYPRPKIKEVVKQSRQLSLKSANFWADYYQLPKNQIRCLNRRLQKQRKVLWPY